MHEIGGENIMKQRKDGRWVQKITLPNGKPKYFYSTAATERQAETDIRRQLLAYQTQNQNGKLFSEVADEWAREHYENLANNTLKQYRPATADAVSYFSGKYIKDIQSNHIHAFINELSSKGYAQKTIKSRLLVCNLIFKFAVINEYVFKNPCQYITLPKNLPKTKRESASTADIEAIKNNVDKPFGLFALFLLLTGCRRGEALALEKKDVDFENGTVHINKTVEWISNTPHIKNSPKTDAGVRSIPLPDVLLDYLGKIKTKYLFPNDQDEIMRNGQVARAWEKYKSETGVLCTPHQLRHAYATILYDAGIDVKTAQAYLGHSDIQTTLAIYTHLSDARQTEKAEQLKNYLNDMFNL